MDYSIGSVADLISGSVTPNKQKVVKKQFKVGRKSSDNASPRENLKGKQSPNKQPFSTPKLRNSNGNNIKVKKQKISISPKVKHAERINSEDEEDSEDESDAGDLSNGKEDDSTNSEQSDNDSSSEDQESTNENDLDFGDINKDSDSDSSDVTEKKTKTKKLKSKSQQVKRKASDEEDTSPASKKSKNEKIPKSQKTKNKFVNDTNENDSNSDTSDDEDEQQLSEKPVKTSNPNHVIIFVGNLPISMEPKKLKKLFSKFGNVVNARIRSVPVADPKIPKKVAAIKKQFHPDRTSVNGYVTFAERESAEKALSLNGTKYKDHHLRVNMAGSTVNPDKNKALFLGNVSFEAEEEELWALFESCGEIESVRLIRDRRTNIGKGFGYINFKSADSVELALQMGEIKLRDRVLRISLYNSKPPKKETQQQEKPNNANRKKFFLKEKGADKGVSNTNSQFQGKFATTEKKKKFNKGTQQKKKLAQKIIPNK